MIVLGLSYNYHDSSASLVIDGKIIASSAEERFSLIKHDPSFPFKSIEFCLRHAGITKKDIDYIVYHEEPLVKLSRTLASSFTYFPNSLHSFIKSSKEAIYSLFWIKNEIANFFEISVDKVIFIPHHLSHAASSFITSGYEDAAIISLDAVGEWAAGGIFKGKFSNGEFDIEPIKMFPFPNSIGLVYSAFTTFLGFKANDGECSTMALAAFGNPEYYQEIKKIIYIENDEIKVDLSYFDFRRDDQLPLTKKFYSVFGQPRDFKKKYSFDCMHESNQDEKNEDKRYANIACSIQRVVEEIILYTVSISKQMTKSENLCYSGGVALNCVANQKILQSRIFNKIHIPNDPGDGGGSLGAALYFLSKRKELKFPLTINPFIGEDYNINSYLNFIYSIDPARWYDYAKIKSHRLTKENLFIKQFETDDEMISECAKILINDEAIGFFQGRFEVGPRALGNRSILLRPDSIKAAKYLSERIKQRASFRPYACVMNDEYATKVIEDRYNGNLNNWMQASFKIKDSFIGKLRAGAHIDHTTRLQIVEMESNAKLYKLISKFESLTGIGALINTSFNESGYPIVSSPYEALIMFARTELKHVVIENVLISKVDINNDI